MAVFRVERNTGYTVMSNHHLRNKELTLKANDFMLFSRTNEKQPIRSSNGIMRQNPPQKIRDSDADWIFGRDAGKSASQPQGIDVEMT